MEQLPKIVRERLRAGQAADHPDPNLLAAFAENSLSEAERLPVVEHLSRCAECREVVMLATNAANSGVPEATSRAGEVAAVQMRSRLWFQMPVVRWAALAACVGFAATLVIRHEWMQTTPSETNLAANHDASRVAKTAPAAPAEAESRQSLAKAQKPAGGSAGKAKTSPVLSASAARPRAKRRAMSSAGRSGSAGREGRELASSSALQITSKPLNASKGAPAAGVNGGIAGSAGGVPGKQAMPAMADAVAGGAASSSTPAGQSQSARRVETEAAADVFNSPNFQPKPAAKSAPSAGAQQGILGGVVAGQAANGPPSPEMSAALKKVASTNPPRWTLSSDGVLERSTDSGKTWTKADVGNGSRFRALSATGFEVWAGGADGLFFHSSDGGAHWTQVHLVANGIPLTSTITHIDFTDAQHGRLTTNTGETWLTTDAGHTWQRQ
jgi:Photosynthesis system II assembly factor YCF48/Putative zinc-finger